MALHQYASGVLTVLGALRDLWKGSPDAGSATTPPTLTTVMPAPVRSGPTSMSPPALPINADMRSLLKRQPEEIYLAGKEKTSFSPESGQIVERLVYVQPKRFERPGFGFAPREEVEDLVGKDLTPKAAPQLRRTHNQDLEQIYYLASQNSPPTSPDPALLSAMTRQQEQLRLLSQYKSLWQVPAQEQLNDATRSFLSNNAELLDNIYTSDVFTQFVKSRL